MERQGKRVYNYHVTDVCYDFVVSFISWPEAARGQLPYTPDGAVLEKESDALAAIDGFHLVVVFQVDHRDRVLETSRRVAVDVAATQPVSVFLYDQSYNISE